MKRLKLIALGYLIKTLLFGIAWFFVPDLPQRTQTAARLTWAWVMERALVDAPVAAVSPKR
jgi:hypothetical protein